MWRIRILSLILPVLLLAGALPSLSHAEETQVEADAKENNAVGGKAGEKGGIYVVGRGFKTAGKTMEGGFVTAGHGMEKGFKAAGHGIKKGGQATGRGFKKAGGSIKNFFTGD